MTSANPFGFRNGTLPPNGYLTQPSPGLVQPRPIAIDLTAPGLQAAPRPQISSASLLGPPPSVPRPPQGAPFPPNPPISRQQGASTAKSDESQSSVVSSAALLGMLPSNHTPPATNNTSDQSKKRKLEEYQKEHGEVDGEQQTRMRTAKAIKSDEQKVGRPDWTNPFADFDDVLNRLLPFHIQYKDEAPLPERDILGLEDPMFLEILTDIHKLNRISSCGVGKEEQLLMMRLSIADAKGRVDARKDIEQKLKDQTKKIAANQKQKQLGQVSMQPPPSSLPTSFSNLLAPSAINSNNQAFLVQQQIKLLQEQQLRALQAKAPGAPRQSPFLSGKPLIPPPALNTSRLPPPPTPLMSYIKPPTIISLPPPPNSAPTLSNAQSLQMMQAMKTTLNFNPAVATLTAPTFPSPLNRNPFPTFSNPQSFQPKPLNLSVNPILAKPPEQKPPQ